MQMPTEFVTWESLATLAGMVLAVWIIMFAAAEVGLPVEYRRIVGLAVSLVLNILAVVLTPPVLPQNIIVAMVNGALTFLVASVALKTTDSVTAKLRE